MINGRNLLVYADGVAVAAAQSCKINVKVEDREISRPDFGDTLVFKPGRYEWSVSVSTLVTEFLSRFSNVGQTVQLTFGVRDTEDSMTGTAILTKSEVSASVGSLVKGSFTFQGVGVLEPYNPLPYDAEIEYLESSGTQYIDTGINLNAALTTQIGLSLTRLNSSASLIFGVWYSSSSYAQSQLYVNASNKWAATNANKISVSGITTGTTAQINTTYNITCTTIAQNGSLTAYLFARNNDGGDYLPYNGLRITSCKISSNNTVLCDFIPVRIGQVGYLYDRVSETLFGNKGTGDFTLGPDKTA